jgi:branched-chain amino acid transport system ATP-binding protein
MTTANSSDVMQGDAAAPENGTSLLQIQNLSSGYGDIRALWDLTLSVDPGRITVLVGRNGAGKTTTLLAIAGMLPIQGGSVRLMGRDLAGLSPQERVRLGVALVPEGKRVFHRLSVHDNLMIGGAIIGDKVERRKGIDDAFMRFPILAQFRNKKAGEMSGGQQQILAIAQALVARPQVLLLDEPSAGLAPKIMDDVVTVIQGLAREGTGVLLVEQVIDIAIPIADRVTLIEGGREIFSTSSPGQDTVARVEEHMRAV